MELADQIRTYLDGGGSFRHGADLYHLAGLRTLQRELDRALQQPYVDPALRRRMTDELRSFLAQAGAGSAAPKAASSLSTWSTRPAPALPASSDEPDQVAAMRQRGRMMKKRQSFLHAQLVNYASQAESNERTARLYEIAREMMEEVEPALDEIYDSIRAWEQEGRLPIADQERLVKDTVGKYKKFISIRTEVYRLRKMLKGNTLSPDERAKEQLRLQEKEEAMRALEKELGLTEEEEE